MLSLDPLTVAANCCCVAPAGQELPASFANKVANPGFTVTVAVPPPPPATAPQEISAINPTPKQIPAMPP
jgi:hypothetical protein